jgi:hypothetical protein
MVNLLWEFRHFVTFMPSGTPWPEGVDRACYLMSLPGLLGINTPEQVPPDPGLISKRVDLAVEMMGFSAPPPRTRALKVGIAWTGNPAQDRNFERTIPLDLFLKLTEDPRVVLYSFQVGHGSEMIGQLGAGQLISDLSGDLQRWGLVGACVAMRDMDLIITACTSTAHLAGAIGAPVWTLLCHDPYWVWLQDGKERDSTVWYPSMRLFHQRTPGDWTDCMARVKSELEALCTAKLGGLS